MEVEIDHYEMLGLPSGEEGAKLTKREISKAYKTKALELHPDKRLNDPNAHSEFQKLKSSFDILKDEKTRKLFDDLLRIKHDQRCLWQSQFDAKLHELRSDREKRKRDVLLLWILLLLKEIDRIVKKFKVEKSQKLVDDLFRIKREQCLRQSQYDAILRELKREVLLIRILQFLEEIERIVRKLKDEIRKLFDDLFCFKHEQHGLPQSQYDAMLRKLVSGLEELESKMLLLQNLLGFDKALEEIERIVKNLKEKIAKIRAMHA